MPQPGKRNDRPRRRPPSKGRRGPTSRRPERRSQATDWGEKPNWGGVARRGAARVDPRRGRTSGIEPPKSRPERDDVGDPQRTGRPDPVAETEEWILESVEVEAQGAVRRGSRRSRPVIGAKQANGAKQGGSRGGSGHEPATRGLFDGLGSAQRAASSESKLEEASRAYSRERYGDALKILRPLARDAPGVAEVRELTGLTHYRLGRWKDATAELEAFVSLTGSTEQHPVLADCARALGRHRAVEEYWDALRRASPSADLVAEGRIVMAGSLADRGRLDDAVALMEAGRRRVSRPKERHLRMAYALADLHERAGDLPAARSGFSWVQQHDPDFGDVVDRLASLR